MAIVQAKAVLIESAKILADSATTLGKTTLASALNAAVATSGELDALVEADYVAGGKTLVWTDLLRTTAEAIEALSSVNANTLMTTQNGLIGTTNSWLETIHKDSYLSGVMASGYKLVVTSTTGTFTLGEAVSIPVGKPAGLSGTIVALLPGVEVAPGVTQTIAIVSGVSGVTQFSKSITSATWDEVTKTATIKSATFANTNAPAVSSATKVTISGVSTTRGTFNGTFDAKTELEAVDSNNSKVKITYPVNLDPFWNPTTGLRNTSVTYTSATMTLSSGALVGATSGATLEYSTIQQDESLVGILAQIKNALYPNSINSLYGRLANIEAAQAGTPRVTLDLDKASITITGVDPSTGQTRAPFLMNEIVYGLTEARIRPASGTGVSGYSGYSGTSGIGEYDIKDTTSHFVPKQNKARVMFYDHENAKLYLADVSGEFEGNEYIFGETSRATAKIKPDAPVVPVDPNQDRPATQDEIARAMMMVNLKTTGGVATVQEELYTKTPLYAKG